MSKSSKKLEARKSAETGTAPEPAAAAKRKPRHSVEGVRLSPDDRLKLYADRRGIEPALRRKCELDLPFATYLQDPFVTSQNEAAKDKDGPSAEESSTKKSSKKKSPAGFDEIIDAPWEPGLTDGPTSARFALVDYNGDTGILEPPAEWDDDQQTFVSSGKPLDRTGDTKFQFHQVSVGPTSSAHWPSSRMAMDSAAPSPGPSKVTG